jgi:sortase (surface protein transpeptidase)
MKNLIKITFIVSLSLLVGDFSFAREKSKSSYSSKKKKRNYHSKKEKQAYKESKLASAASAQKVKNNFNFAIL